MIKTKIIAWDQGQNDPNIENPPETTSPYFESSPQPLSAPEAQPPQDNNLEFGVSPESEPTRDPLRTLFESLNVKTATFQRRQADGERMVKNLRNEENQQQDWQSLARQSIRVTVSQRRTTHFTQQTIVLRDEDTLSNDVRNGGFGVTTHKFGSVHPTKLAVASGVKVWAFGKDDKIADFMKLFLAEYLAIPIADIPLTRYTSKTCLGWLYDIYGIVPYRRNTRGGVFRVRCEVLLLKCTRSLCRN
jgi:hypothetical protein